MTRSGRPLGREGAAAVEFGVLASFVLIPLLLGLWEVGRMVEAQQLLDNAVREACRQAASGRRSEAQVEQFVVDYMAMNGVAVNSGDVSFQNVTAPTRSDPRPGNSTSTTNTRQLDRLRVTVSVPVDRTRWVLLPRITSGATLNASADWVSMNDIPLTVSSDIPTRPS